MTDVYEERSYAQVPIGFGHKPGIVVVDYQVGFTDSQYPLGGAPLVMRGVENTQRLLEKARKCGVPVANCYTELREYARVNPLFFGIKQKNGRRATGYVPGEPPTA